jgi:hypothetical protein
MALILIYEITGSNTPKYYIGVSPCVWTDQVRVVRKGVGQLLGVNILSNSSGDPQLRDECKRFRSKPEKYFWVEFLLE